MRPENSLRIGIDIDGTVTDPGSIVPLMNESFGKNLRYEQCTDYNLATVYDISEIEFLAWLNQHGERLYDTSPVHGTADQVLRRWHREHQLIYISAREARYLDVTVSWFQRFQIPFHEIACIGSHDKVAAAQKWQIDLFLEDRLENALQLSEALKIPVFMFDTPYNQGTLPPLVHRVHSWDEVSDKLASLPLVHNQRG